MAVCTRFLYCAGCCTLHLAHMHHSLRPHDVTHGLYRLQASNRGYTRHSAQSQTQLLTLPGVDAVSAAAAAKVLERPEASLELSTVGGLEKGHPWLAGHLHAAADLILAVALSASGVP
jgi:hypothetical protein